MAREFHPCRGPAGSSTGPQQEPRRPRTAPAPRQAGPKSGHGAVNIVGCARVSTGEQSPTAH